MSRGLLAGALALALSVILGLGTLWAWAFLNDDGNPYFAGGITAAVLGGVGFIVLMIAADGNWE